ncbi:DUF6282 family protein [Thermodesulfobacteriota bacterium]
MKTEADSLLRNAIDMHCHCYPDISLDCRSPKDDMDTLQLACNAGMRGIVLKGQIWPTIGEVYELRKLLPDINIWSSITLNATAGGVKTWVVESAAKQGAKVVWMPTWSAEHRVKDGWPKAQEHLKKYLPTLQQYHESEEGIRITNGAGQLKDEVVEVLRMVNDFDMVLSTGHLSLEESLALAEQCYRMGFKKLIWGHPFSRGAPPSDVIKAMVNLGAYVEFTALNAVTLGVRLPPTEMAKAIQDIGYERCILSSDAFLEWAPHSSEFLRMLVVMLLDSGIPAQAIKVMIQDNPATLLGIETIEKQNSDLAAE